MIIKSPVSIDVSRYRIISDWATLVPPVYLGITKATESLTYVDPTFIKHMQGMRQAGIHRGCYHFHRKAQNPVLQAIHFCDTIRAYIDRDTLLILDVEEGGETAAQLKAFFEEVIHQFPDNLLFIYSRKNILDPIPMFLRPLVDRITPHPLNAIQMTLAERTFFRQNVLTWTAGYPNNPDLFTSPPAYYIPDQTKWGPCWLWQYTDRGQIAGAPAEGVDCNWVAPELVATLGPIGEPTQPPADVITNPHPGMQRVSGVRHGWKFELFISDPAKVRLESVCLSPLETVGSVTRRKGATLGVNGGEWDRVSQTKDYTVSDGFVCHVRISAVPSLMILGDGLPFINHTATANVKHALSGLRYLIRAGTIQSYLDGTEPAYTEGHARSIHGTDEQGRHMVLQSTGVYPNQGLTLKQAAELMKQYGAFMAFDSGGGGDVTCILDGVSLIVPENPNGAERALPNVFLIYAEGEQTMTRYEATAIGNGTRLRPEHNTNNNYLASYNAGTKFHGDLIWIAAADIYELVNGVNTLINKEDDEWLEVTDVNGAPKAGWVAIKHMGEPICTIVDNQPTVPPPTTGEIHFEGTFHSDGTFTGTWTDT